MRSHLQSAHVCHVEAHLMTSSAHRNLAPGSCLFPWCTSRVWCSMHSLCGSFSPYLCWLRTAVLDLILAHPACRSKQQGLYPASSHSCDGPLQDNCWGQPVARSVAIQQHHRALWRILDNSPLVWRTDPCHISTDPRPFSAHCTCDIIVQQNI